MISTKIEAEQYFIPVFWLLYRLIWFSREQRTFQFTFDFCPAESTFLNWKSSAKTTKQNGQIRNIPDWKNQNKKAESTIRLKNQ